MAVHLAHDLRGGPALVIGGGPVALRKVRRLATETECIVLSPLFARTDAPAAYVRTAVTPAALEGWIARTAPSIVVVATDDHALNTELEAVATAAGVLVNRTTASARADTAPADPLSVQLPAVADLDGVTVSIATGGASPALAGYLREQIEDRYAQAGAMARLLAELHDRLRAAAVDTADRRTAMRAVLRAPAVWKGLDTGVPKAREEADQVIASTLEEEL
jgi:precorrin-2 dehydrogenase/sirohydrochlorin ferrochelatase